MKYKFLTLIPALFFPIKSVLAHCPLCTMATGAVLVSARLLGIDDAIIGVLFGAFIIATSLWANNILLKKKIRWTSHQEEIIVLFGLVSSLLTLQLSKLFDGNLAPLYGFNRLLLGTIVGSFTSYIGHLLHNHLRWLNNEQNYIPYQGLVMILAATIIAVVGIGVLI